jgi:RNA polymerase sigma-B factor
MPAAQLGISRQELFFVHNGGTAYRPVSLDQPVAGAQDLYLVDVLDGRQSATDAEDNRETLRVLLAGLPGRERQIIGLHFYADMTQSQIAAQIGVSQMHVSRLLARSLARLQATARTDLVA